MSTVIDERVVEMSFDNREFEKNAKASMLTLEDLKQALDMDGAAKSFNALDKAANSVSLEGIAAGVQALQDRFSAFGVMGMEVVRRITSALIDMASQAVGFLSTSVVSGGYKRAMNIENAHFQLQALLKDEELVQQYMDAANKSVTGTAFAYDEAAKAASMFAASGIQAGEDVERALSAVVGVAAMTNSDYESISRIFTTVAGNGRLMGDQLLQLSSRGMNAAATIADYFREVRGEANITEADIREMVSKGKISFETFASAMQWAFGDSALRANETFTGAFSNMKAALARIGQGFFSPLVAQNSEVVQLFNTLKDRINDVKAFLVFDEEAGNVEAFSKQFTDAVLKVAKATREFVATMDVETPLSVFYSGLLVVTNAFKGLYSVAKPIGQAFANVFLDFSADDVHNLGLAIADLSEKLIITGSTANTIRRAFEMFFGLIHNTVSMVVVTLLHHTDDLNKAFTGLKGVVKLLIVWFGKFAEALTPIWKPLNAIFSLVLDGIGYFGDLLTKFVDFANATMLTSKIFDPFAKKFDAAMTRLRTYIFTLRRVVTESYALKTLRDALTNFAIGFQKIGSVIFSYVKGLVSNIHLFSGSLKSLIPLPIKDWIDTLARKIYILSVKFRYLNIDQIKEQFKSFLKTIKEAFTKENIGKTLNWIVNQFKSFVAKIGEALGTERITRIIDKFKAVFEPFGKWIKEKFSTLFGDTSVGGLLAVAGVFLVFRGIIKSIKTLFATVKGMFNLSGLLVGIKDAIKAYQSELRASTILKIAGAIGILSLALVALSYINTDNLEVAAGAMVAVGSMLIYGIDALSKALNRGANLESAVSKYIASLGFAKKLGSISGLIKNFAKSMAIIVGSIVAIALMYKYNGEYMEQAVTLVAQIGVALAAMAAGMSIISAAFSEGSANFKDAATGALFLSGALLLVVISLKSLMGVTLPEDWETKLWIIGSLLVGLGALAVLVGASAGLSDGNKLRAVGPILALTAMLWVSVSALKKLFSITLPDDWLGRVAILAGIFVGLVYIVKALGNAAKESENNLKATGSILAMALFVGVVVAALAVLAIIPLNPLIKGAVALGLVLVALGTSLAIASGYSERADWKSILAMALAVGAITVALGVLSMIPLPQLAKAAVALGVILGVLAVDLNYAGKVVGKSTWKTVLAMCLQIVVIAGALSVLSGKPWKGMILGAVSIGIVLGALAGSLKLISGASGLKANKIPMLLAAVLGIAVIAGSLYFLADIPWQNFIAPVIALGLVFGALIYSLTILSKSSGLKTSKVPVIAAGIVAIAAIATSLYFLAKQPWGNMLASMTALSVVLLAMTGALAIVSNIKLDLSSIGSLAVAIIAMGAVSYALYQLASHPWQDLIGAVVAIGLAFAELIVVMIACAAIGDIAGAAAGGAAQIGVFLLVVSGVLVLLGLIMTKAGDLVNGGIDLLVSLATGIGRFIGAFVEGVMTQISEGFPTIGQNLSDFMTNLQPFLEGAAGIDEGTISAIGNLASVILTLTKSELLDGITRLITGGSSLGEFGTELANFGPAIADFASTVDGISASSVEGAAAAANMMAAVAENLPDTGGLEQKLFGEKSLSEFADELNTFAPALVNFAEQTSGITENSVSGAASAAKMMAEVASNLPESDTWYDKLFGGGSSLSSFAEELEAFGPSIKQFANDVSGISESTVSGAASAAQMIATLAENLPAEATDTGGIFSSGKLEAFGTNLVNFGQSLVDYYNKISQVNFETIGNVSEELGSLVELVTTLTGLNTTVLSDFVNGLGQLGINGVNEFILAFQNGTENVITAIELMLEAVLEAIAGKDKAFNTKGQTSASKYLNGITTKAGTSGKSAGTTLASKVISGLETKLKDFLTKGTEAAAKYISGLEKADGSGAGRKLAETIIDGFKNADFYTAGSDGGQGLINGFRSKISESARAAADLANAAKKSAKQTLDEHSPSKEMEKIGAFGGDGFILGLLKKVSPAGKAASELGEESMKGLQKSVNTMMQFIDENMDLQPVLSPTVDLSNLQASTGLISDMFNRSIGVTMDKVAAASSSMSRRDLRIRAEEEARTEESTGNTVTFNQYNNSPKALSRIEIYRQTRNQLAQMKGALQSS